VDDLLRNTVAHHFNYDYSKVYPEAVNAFPSSMWIGFEYLISPLEKSIANTDAVVKIVQSLAIFLSYISIFLALRHVTRSSTYGHVITATLLVLYVHSGAAIRPFTGRPEVFFTAYLFSAIFLNKYVWLLLGALMSPMYWLAPMFSIGGVLTKGSIKEKIITTIVAFGAMSAFWLLYIGNDWINSIMMVPKLSEARIIGISELNPLTYQVMTNPWFWLAATYCTSEILRSHKLKRDLFVWGLITVIIGFGLFNVNRYHAIVFTALILLTAYVLQSKEIQRLKAGDTFFLITILAFVTLSAFKGLQTKESPKFTFDNEAYVFSESMHVSQSLLKDHKGKVKVMPGYDTAIETTAHQMQIKALKKGTINCDTLKNEKYTHVIESSLKTIPDCLELQDVSGKWRKWKIKKATDESVADATHMAGKS
jgi:hypothetical protein